ncbi:hypothetical protein [Tardiphaga sp. 862_B3_N1_1]|uniref:hypothetical protein n=1 Tax=Tardiphaga sp. 862_B3_N1_1 TaxID=3240763 RepID=UPI003F8B586B
MPIERDEFRDLEKEVRESKDQTILLGAKVVHLENAVKELVSKAEFFPVKLIAYGLAAGALSAVVTAVVSNVIAK